MRPMLPSPFTARDVYRNEWTGLTEPRVVQGALACLAELGWLRSEAVRTPAGGRPAVRFRINPRLLAGRHERSRHVPPEAFRRSSRPPRREQPNLGAVRVFWYAR